MTVPELHALHRRYVSLSHRFRAAWVFHQFLNSLEKVFQTGTEAYFGEEFQQLYTELKEISQGLTASETERTQAKLEQVRDRLASLTVALAQEDTKISPRLLRRFLQRFKNYDEKVLLQLARFYVVCGKNDYFGPDRLDKLDFLLTRLGERQQEGDGAMVPGDHKHLTEVFESLWVLSGADPPIEHLVEQRCREIEELRARLPEVETLDGLDELGILSRYRQLKHALGELFLEPALLSTILETNLAFKNLVHRLYHQDERRIVADYQEIFELERETPVDMQLDQELSQFRKEIERFESQLQEDELKLAELSYLRQRMRSLKPRLKKAAKPRAGFAVTRTHLPAPAVPEGEEPPPPEEVIEADLQLLLDTLGASVGTTPAKAVALSPDVYPLRLEPREVVAFRRSSGAGHEGVDRALEQFLLEAAAVRIRLRRQAEEIKGLLDETSRDEGAPIFAEARRTLDLADSCLRRFSSAIDRLILVGDAVEARSLLLLRVRLMREYSGLWLLAYKPFLPSPPE